MQIKPVTDKADLRLNESVTVKDWWEACHQEADQLWLTGSRGPEVWEYLGIEDRILPGAVVLNIGVGLGHCTRALAARGCLVQVLDIAETALERVKEVTTNGWLASDLGALPSESIDLAISNLVAQHVNNASLSAQIEAVLRSLKPDGVFAMQFAYAEEDSANDVEHRPAACAKGGGECRSLAGMTRLVNQAGGRVVWAKRIGYFPAFGSGWYGLHIVGPNYPYIHSELNVREGMALRSLDPRTWSFDVRREVFLCELNPEDETWAEVLLAYFQAFAPGDPVRLGLVLNPEKVKGIGPEEAQGAVFQLAEASGRRRFPDVQVIEGYEALLTLLREQGRAQWVSGPAQGTAGGLIGEAGHRLMKALVAGRARA